MADCNKNGKMIRYAVGITQGCGWDSSNARITSTNLDSVVPVDTGAANVKYLQAITRVGGISLGEEGEVEVPEWDTTSIISDGKRKIQTLTTQVRVSEAFAASVTAGSSDANIMALLYSLRDLITLNVYLFITARDWSVLYYYKFIDSQIKKFSQEDQELGAAKLGLIDIDFAPYDVELYPCDSGAAPLVSNAASGGAGGFAVTFC